MSHVLVTNDFPPKVGGIQSYLWELWRRLDPSSFTVLTSSSDPGAAEFDEEQSERGIRIERLEARMLLPTPGLARRVESVVASTGSSLVVLDPALPLGAIGRTLSVPYAVVLHGAEVTVPGHLPLSRSLLASVLARARLLICAGSYPASEARRSVREMEAHRVGAPASDRYLEIAEVPPGVDTDRFRVLDRPGRAKARAAFGLPERGLVVLSVSRLIPRKGMDVLIEAAAALRRSFPELVVAIGGEGRDRSRLERIARRSGAPAVFLGRVPDAELPDLYGSADVFVMACRDRWAGLEQEGFGIVFLEAAACGVPQVAGRSGGAAEAVAHGETGFVVDEPSDPARVASALRRLLSDGELRLRMGESARRRAQSQFDYDLLSRRLADVLGTGIEV